MELSDRQLAARADRPDGQLERQLTLSLACVVRDGPPWLAKPPFRPLITHETCSYVAASISSSAAKDLLGAESVHDADRG